MVGTKQPFWVDGQDFTGWDMSTESVYFPKSVVMARTFIIFEDLGFETDVVIDFEILDQHLVIEDYGGERPHFYTPSVGAALEIANSFANAYASRNMGKWYNGRMKEATK